MEHEALRVVLHARQDRDGRVHADDWFVRALRADGIPVTVEQSEPEPPAGSTFHGESLIAFVVEHLHVYLPYIKDGAAGAGVWLAGKVGDEAWSAMKRRVVAIFVKSAKERIQKPPRAEHEKTATIYDAYGRPLSEVTVRGVTGREPKVTEREP